MDCKKILDDWWLVDEPFGFDHPDTYNGILACMEKAVESLKAENEQLKQKLKLSALLKDCVERLEKLKQNNEPKPKPDTLKP